MEGWFIFNHPFDDLRSNAQQYQLDLIYQINMLVAIQYMKWKVGKVVTILTIHFMTIVPCIWLSKNFHASGRINPS